MLKLDPTESRRSTFSEPMGLTDIVSAISKGLLTPCFGLVELSNRGGDRGNIADKLESGQSVVGI